MSTKSQIDRRIFAMSPSLRATIDQAEVSKRAGR
jgi:hypothetical protein